MNSIDAGLHRSLYCGSCNAVFKAITPGFTHGSQARALKTPLILKCGHTLCEACVRRLLKVNKTGVVCSTCEVSTLVQSDNVLEVLPADIHVLGLTLLTKKSAATPEMFDKVGTIIKSQNELGPGAASGNLEANEFCSECCRVEATCTCVKCESNMCQPCFDKVHRAKILRKHKPIALRKKENSLTCAQHDNRLMEYYCEEDNEIICSRCYIVGDHQKHQITPLEEKNKSMVASIRPALGAAERFVRKAKSSVKVLHSVMPQWKAELDKKIAEVNTHFHLLHSHLQLRELEVIKELRECYCTNTFPAQEIKQEMENDIRNIQNLIRSARQMLDRPNSMDNSVSVAAQLTRVREIPCAFTAPDKISANISFKFNDDLMKNIISKYGTLDQVPGVKNYEFLCLDELSDDDDDTESVSSSLATSDDVLIEDGASVSDTSSTQSGTPRSRRPNDDDSEASDALFTPESSKVKARTTLMPPSLDQYKSEMATVCHVKNPCDFLVQMTSRRRRFVMMSNDINRWCKSVAGRAHRPTRVETDDLYLGQFTADNLWYRCRVKSVEQTCDSGLISINAHVVYVDYGNAETIPISRLLTMPAKFFREPEFAIKCSLVDVVPANQMGEWTEAANNMFSIMTRTTDICLRVQNHSRDVLYVDLSKPPSSDIADDRPISVRDALVFLEMACLVSPHSLGSSSSTKERQYVPRMMPEAGERLSGFVCHVDGPDKFFIQTVGDEVTYLDTMSDELQRKYNTDKNDLWTQFCPTIDMICVARQQADQKWYRARVVDLPGGRVVTVAYVDYGNTETVSVWEVKKILDEFMILPPQALQCCLADIMPSDGEGWTTEASEHFSKLVLQKLIVLDVKERAGESILCIAHDYSDNCEVNFNRSMVKLGYAVCTEPRSLQGEVSLRGVVLNGREALERKKIAQANCLSRRSSDKEKEDLALSIVDEAREGRFYPVRVSRLVSPGEIYLQTITTGDYGLDSLTEELDATYRDTEPDDTEDWLPETVVAVQHPVEDKWYRALVVNCHDADKINVFLPDTGHELTVASTALRRLLNAELLGLPCYANRCHLEGVQPAGGGKWSATSCQLISDTIKPLTQCKVLKKGEAIGESQPIDLIVEDVIPGDALNCDRIKHISLSRLLIEKGLAFPKKSSTGSIKKDTSPPASDHSSSGLDVLDDLDLDRRIARTSQRTKRISISKYNERKTYVMPILRPSVEAMKVVATYFDMDCILYVQDLDNDATVLDQLMHDLELEYADSDSEPDMTWMAGQAVVARHSEDQAWYRGIIDKIDADGIMVIYVDYGNGEYVPPHNLRSQVIHMTIPKLCYSCKIKGLRTTSGDGVWPINSLNYIDRQVVGQTCLVQIEEDPVINQPLVVTVTLPNGRGDLLTHLVKCGLALPPRPEHDASGDDNDVPRTDVDLVSDAESELPDTDMTTPEKEIEKRPNLALSSPLYSEKMLIGINASGNKNSSAVRDNDDVHISAETASACEIQTNGMSDSQPDTTTEQSEKSSGERQRWQSWSEDQEDDCIVEPRHSRYVPLPPPPVGQYASVLITSALTPDMFYAQRSFCEDDSPESVEINKQLEEARDLCVELHAEASTLPTLHVTEAEIGMAVCSMYSFDNHFYRGEIIDVQGVDCTVKYVDYGNKESQNICDVRELPEKYLKLPAQAMLLRVNGLKPLDEEWSTDAQLMLEFVENKQCVIRTVNCDEYPPAVDVYEAMPVDDEEPRLLHQRFVDANLALLDPRPTLSR